MIKHTIISSAFFRCHFYSPRCFCVPQHYSFTQLELHPLKKSLLSDSAHKSAFSISPTRFIWVPSHVDILGNTRADQLVSDCLRNPMANRLSNSHTPSELLPILKKKYYAFKNTHHLHFNAIKHNLMARKRPGLIPWQLHPIKMAVRFLHRLRSNHNRLNKWLSRDDPDIDPLCNRDCSGKENTQHVLMVFPDYGPFRTPFKRILATRKKPLDFKSVISINMDTNPSLQFIIRGQL